MGWIIFVGISSVGILEEGSPSKGYDIIVSLLILQYNSKRCSLMFLSILLGVNLTHPL